MADCWPQQDGVDANCLQCRRSESRRREGEVQQLSGEVVRRQLGVEGGQSELAWLLFCFRFSRGHIGSLKGRGEMQ